MGCLSALKLALVMQMHWNFVINFLHYSTQAGHNSKQISQSSFGHPSKKMSFLNTNNNGKLLNNRASTNMSSVEVDYVKAKSLNKSNLEKFAYSNEESYALNKNMQGSKGVKFDKVNTNASSTLTNNPFDGQSNKANSMATSQSAADMFYPAISNFFSQLNNSNSSNNSTPLAMYPTSQQSHPKKPILKSSQSSDYSSSMNQRRGSVLSIGSNQSSKSSTHSGSNNNKTSGGVGKNAQMSNTSSNLADNLNKLNERIGTVKLPPIARCSEDFYAVLHGMEKDRLV